MFLTRNCETQDRCISIFNKLYSRPVITSDARLTNLGNEESSDGGCQEVLGEEVDEGEDHQVEDGQGELVAVEQQGVERVTAILR